MFPHSSKYPYWSNDELKKSIQEKNKLHKLYKSTGTNLAYNNFTIVSKKCKNLSKLCYNRYLQNIQRFLTCNPKYFFKKT